MPIMAAKYTKMIMISIQLKWNIGHLLQAVPCITTFGIKRPSR
jgi:hypothetical protein